MSDHNSKKAEGSVTFKNVAEIYEELVTGTLDQVINRIFGLTPLASTLQPDLVAIRPISPLNTLFIINAYLCNSGT